MVNLHSYDKARKEHTLTLSEGWRFIPDINGGLTVEAAELELRKHGTEVKIPSVWNYLDGLFDYEGVSWYSCDFTADIGRHKLVFEGVCNDAKVWLDGKPITEHVGAFLGFATYLDFAERGGHTLTVRVSNITNTENTIPAAECDWKRYGGIIRPVRLTALPSEYIDGMHVIYTLDDELKSANVLTRVEFYGKKQAKYELIVNGERLGEYTIVQGENEIVFKLDSIRLWDVGKPNLYYITLASECDSETIRIGFKRVRAKDGKITLNGRPIVLRGVNRHEEKHDCGHALPREVTEGDLDLITELGSNTVRGSHYPNSRDMLDLCDERGILFWSELPLWQYTEAQASEPAIIDQALRMGREMVLECMHHPSIFCWGLHNECATETESFRLLSEKLFTLYRELDPSRLITFATDRAMTDICLDYCDFISVNRYPGWYGKGVSEWYEFIAELRVRAKALGIGDKPIVVSEFGAGAIPGYRSPYKVKWSEELQVDILTRSIEIFYELGLAGVLVWQFADIRVSDERALYRPRCFNNKGLLSEDRIKKLAFDRTKEAFKKASES